MGLPDDSWHLRYYEYSYLFYITFTACFVAFYILIYCIKVPTRRFTNLKDILENDPIINSYKFRTPEKLPKKPFTFGQTTVPQDNLISSRMKMKKEESVKLMYNQLLKRRQSQDSAEMRLRKASTVSHGSEPGTAGILKVPKSDQVEGSQRRSSGSEKKSGSETETIEKMLDDINQKLQESADEIVQVRFSQDEYDDDECNPDLIIAKIN